MRLSLCHLAQCGLLSKPPLLPYSPPLLSFSPPALRPKPPPKLQRSPYCWQLSLPPLPFSENPRPASISRRYSIHRRRALITKQDYGPCLGTTCQGACSLSCSLSTTHILHRRVCLCVFWEGDGDLTSSDGDTVQIIVNLFKYASLPSFIDAYLRIVTSMNQWNINI